MIQIQHIAMDVTQACQLSCVGCNHSVPLWRVRPGGPWNESPESVARDLKNISRVAHTQEWAAMGGEPLIHPKLVDILKVARDSGFMDQIQVWTNGLLLKKMSAEFWRSFDKMVFSVYPGKHDDESVAWIVKKCEDEGILIRVVDERHHPNFMTMLEPEPTDPVRTKDKFNRCYFRGHSRMMNYGHFYTCCCAPHLPMLVQNQPYGTDGIALEGLTEEGLYNYLTREDPLGCCTICAGRETAQAITWAEIKDPARWISASKGLDYASLR